MSHELYIDVRGKSSMAYVEDEPWHGLGQNLTPDATFEEWAREAGMNYTVRSTPMLYRPEGAEVQPYGGKVVLYRSDTRAPLGAVGNGYNVVQPLEVLHFFQDLVATGGFSLNTAGVLYNGAKYWALAKTGHEAVVGGKNSKDRVKGYLLLATSCDGTLQTTAQFTSVRVVCNNTLTASLLSPTDKIGAIKVSHRSKFDEKVIKTLLGLDAGWEGFVDAANVLAKIKIDSKKAHEFVTNLLGDKATNDKGEFRRDAATILQLFEGKARGSDMRSSSGTAWGLLNGVTEFVDHLAGKDQNNRLKMAWFYDGNVLKQRAMKGLLELA